MIHKLLLVLLIAFAFGLSDAFYAQRYDGIRPLSARYPIPGQQPSNSNYQQMKPTGGLNFIDSNSRYFKKPYSASWHYNRFANQAYYK